MSARPRRYLIALGSNQRHHRHGGPRQVLRAALQAMERAGLPVERASKVIMTRPLGPSQRTFANAAAIVASDLEPDRLIGQLKAIEAGFGRRSWRRWGPRVLDLDIVLWEGGAWCSPGLTVPHVAFRERRFVLEPAAEIAPDWRDPLSGRTIRQLARRRYIF